MWFGPTAKSNKWYDQEDAPGSENMTSGNTVLYKFYKKPVSSKLGILGRSACPEKQKVSTATAEYLRRWKNTSTLAEKEEIETITIDYSDELAGMGYSVNWRRNVISAALTGYKKICQKEDRNRSGKSTAMGRRWKKLVGQTKWFENQKDKPEEGRQENCQSRNRDEKRKVGRDDRQTESVYFIPYTPGGRLRKELTEMERRLDYSKKVKYVEKLGPAIKDMLGGDPFKDNCGRMNCFPCRSGNIGRCMGQNATYEITCQICQIEKGKKTSYIGETARTPFERGADHLGDLKNWRMSNALVKHLAESHPGRGWDHFSMKVLNTHRSPMERQIKEGQLISNYKGDEILNQKGEWGQNLPQG